MHAPGCVHFGMLMSINLTHDIWLKMQKGALSRAWLPRHKVKGEVAITEAFGKTKVPGFPLLSYLCFPPF